MTFGHIQHRFWFACGTVFGLLSYSAAWADDDAAAVRKWNDRTGKFSIEARFDSMNGDRAVLIKPDGKRIEVPLAKLADDDAALARKFAETVSENPFQEVGADAPAPAAAAPVATTPTASTPRKANWHDAKLVRPQTFKTWSFKPSTTGSKPPIAAGSNTEIPLRDIIGSDKFFEKVNKIAVADDGSRAIVVRKKGEVSQNEQQFVEWIDLAQGKSMGMVRMPGSTEMLDVLPDQGLVMYRPEAHGFGKQSLLTIARFDGSQLTTVKQWSPYEKEDWEPRRDITNAWFISGDRVMTTNMHGDSLTVWDVNSAKALVSVPVGSSMMLKTALSPDRSLLGIVMKDGIALIDLAGGKHVATIPTEGQHVTQLAIRGDNTRLAALLDDGAAVWDLATGKKMHEVFHSAVSWNDNVDWAGDYLLIGNQYLFDVGRRILLWEYQDAPGSDKSATMAGGRLWVVPRIQRDKETVLISTAMPHASALEEAQKLPSAEELLCVRPGDKVAVEVDIDPSVQFTDEIRKSLTANLKKAGMSEEDSKIVVLNPAQSQNDLVRRSLTVSLEAAGLKVVDHADLVVKAVCKPQPPQQIKVNVDDRFPVRDGDIQERTITPHASYLEMTLKGETLWRRGGVTSPGMMIWAQKGESLDQALDRLTKPNMGLFTSTKFSAYVARPGKATTNGAYGVSQFTTGGVIDGKSSGGGKGLVFQ